MLGCKWHGGTLKTKESRAGPVRVSLFWNSHCVICISVEFIPYHVTGSCKGPIKALPWIIKTKLISSHPKIWRKIVFHSNTDVFTQLELFINYMYLKSKKMYTFAGFAKSTGYLFQKWRETKLFFYSTCFQCYVPPFKMIFWGVRQVTVKRSRSRT